MYCPPKVRPKNLTFGGLLMAKYSAEFKLNIVKEYLNGHLGFKTLAKKHNIANSNLIMDWVRNYHTMGDEGLQRSRKNKTYSF